MAGWDGFFEDIHDMFSPGSTGFRNATIVESSKMSHIPMNYSENIKDKLSMKLEGYSKLFADDVKSICSMIHEIDENIFQQYVDLDDFIRDEYRTRNVNINPLTIGKMVRR